jgi:hypothetical protein
VCRNSSIIIESEFIFPIIDTEFDIDTDVNTNKHNIKQSTCSIDIINALHRAVMYEGNMEAGKELFKILPSKVIQATIECDTSLQHKLQQITQNTIRMFRRNGIEGYLHIANYYLQISSDISKKYYPYLDIIDHKLFKAAYSLIIAINSVLEQIQFEFDQDGEIFDFTFNTHSGKYVQIVSDGSRWIVNPEFLAL